MSKPIILILICILTGCTEYPMDFTTAGTGFILKSVGFEGRSRKYCIYVPGSYSDDSEWPLIIFFHGSGERGMDGKKQCSVGLGPAIDAHPDWFPCLILLPQESRNEELPWSEALDQTLKDYRIDENRIYLTGLSVGGTYTWITGAEYPDRFAALMPLCGEGKPDLAQSYLEIPVWIFHGTDDDVVPVEESRNMYKIISELGGDVRFTEFPETGHECWNKVYQNQEYINWLLNNNRYQP